MNMISELAERFSISENAVRSILEETLKNGTEKPSRFIEKEDCYKDRETGLEWSNDDLGEFTWDEVLETIEKNLSNTDWRLPTIDELFAIINHSKTNPATDLPKMEPSYYWSATTYAPDTTSAWWVYFGNGAVSDSDKMNPYYVRLVRDKKEKRFENTL